MKSIAKKYKTISYLLTFLMLLQSCVVYRGKTYTSNEISEFTDGKIKIITVDGKKYRFDWIEVTDEYVFSQINVKRAFLKKSDVETVIINNPPREISIEEAVNHKGNSYIRTKNAPRTGKNNYKLYNLICMDVRDADEYLKVYTMTQSDTSTVIIPLDQVQKIQVQDRSLSGLGTFGIVLLSLTAFGTLMLALDPPDYTMDFSQ